MDISEIVRAICVGGVALSALVDISPKAVSPTTLKTGLKAWKYKGG